MTLEQMVLGFLAAAVIWVVAVEVLDRRRPSIRRPRTAASTDVLPCLHDWTRRGYCATCGEYTAEMNRARRRHPAGGDW